ncbi:MAG: 2-C-methyl-D-erythritol 2,4-cyclodiphosphate synthase [Bacteroides sp.]|nr:2-C-methyl-D-erythritol 2,4-cyclodiphosphate synthase [Bacteroides sp.]
MASPILPDFRTGNGFDVHAFAPDRKLWLCGVEIPSEMGLAGHSDADVAIHALCDALLGAAAMGDIGHHFPDTDPRYKGIDSRLLLRHVADLLSTAGFAIGNIDVTIIAQAPKLAPYIENMRQCLAADLGIAIDRVSVKATTTEKLGFTGRREGIAALASALIARTPANQA